MVVRYLLLRYHQIENISELQSDDEIVQFFEYQSTADEIVTSHELLHEQQYSDQRHWQVMVAHEIHSLPNYHQHDYISERWNDDELIMIEHIEYESIVAEIVISHEISI